MQARQALFLLVISHFTHFGATGLPMTVMEIRVKQTPFPIRLSGPLGGHHWKAVQVYCVPAIASVVGTPGQTVPVLIFPQG